MAFLARRGDCVAGDEGARACCGGAGPPALLPTAALVPASREGDLEPDVVDDGPVGVKFLPDRTSGRDWGGLDEAAGGFAIGIPAGGSEGGDGATTASALETASV